MNTLLGIKIDNIPKAVLLEKVKKYVDSNKRCQIVTLNTELLVASKEDKNLAELITRAQIVIPESSGLYLADNYLASKNSIKLINLVKSGWSTLAGKRKTLPERIAGVDFCQDLAAMSSEFGYRLVLLGGKEGVAKQAENNLKQVYPNLKVKGIFGGIVGIDDQPILKQVQKEKADILFVAFGQPTQEFWISENLEKLNVKVAIGVGGTLDFMAGIVPRAPLWVRRIGLEWVYRLVRQPSRIKRQFALVKFVNLLLKIGRPVF